MKIQYLSNAKYTINNLDMEAGPYGTSLFFSNKTVLVVISSTCADIDLVSIEFAFDKAKMHEKKAKVITKYIEMYITELWTP